MESGQPREGVGYWLGATRDHGRRNVLRRHIVESNHSLYVERRVRMSAVKSMFQLRDPGSDDMLRSALATLGFWHSNANLKNRKLIFEACEYEVCEGENIWPVHSHVGETSLAARQLVHVDENVATKSHSLQRDLAVKKGLLESFHRWSGVCYFCHRQSLWMPRKNQHLRQVSKPNRSTVCSMHESGGECPIFCLNRMKRTDCFRPDLSGGSALMAVAQWRE